MTYYRVDPAGCARTFSEVERHISAARKKHESVSQDVDEVRALCAKGEAAQVASALSRVYNDPSPPTCARPRRRRHRPYRARAGPSPRSRRAIMTWWRSSNARRGPWTRSR